MYLKTLLAAATLAILPGLSFAQCFQKDAANQQAMSCVAGTQWDETTAACVPTTSS